MTRFPVGTHAKGRSLVSHLILFGLALTVPIFIFAGVVLWKYARTERVRMETEAQSNARAIASDIGQDVKSLGAAMQVLAISDALRRGELAAFQADLDAVEAAVGLRVVLRTGKGGILAAPRSYGIMQWSRLPSYPAGTAAGPQVGNFFLDPAGDVPGFAINLPVAAPPDASLTLISTAAALAATIARTPLPPDWDVAVIDAAGTVMARSPLQDQFEGQPAVDDFKAALAAPEGTWRGPSRTGTPRFAAFTRSSVAGWQVSVSAREAILDKPLRRSLQMLGMSGASLAALALVLAWGVGKRMTNAVGFLTATVAHAEREPAAARPVTGVSEFDIVSQRLSQVARGLYASGEALTASRDRMTRILDTMPGGIIEVARDGTVVFANAMVCKMLQMAEADVVGRHFHQLVTAAADPAGRSLDMADLPIARALRGLNTMDFEQVLVAKTGARMAISVNAIPVRDRDGSVAGALAAIADVTARIAADAGRRQMERRLRTIIETVPVGLVLAAAPEGRVIEGNAAAEAILGHEIVPSSGDDADAAFTAFHEDGRPVARSGHPMARVLSGAEDRAELECHYRRGDGSMLWIKIVAAPLRGAGGEISGAVVGILDIDSMKTAQAQQRLMNRELHHRVKNTLATVQGLANLTARSARDIESFRQTLTGRIISLSRTHTLLVENSWGFIPLTELLHLETEPYSTGDPRRISLAGKEVMLPSDIALALGMAFHELGTNALKFGALSTARGAIRIEWTVQSLVDGRRLWLTWTESGGPPVTPPARTGFGSQLLTSILSRQLKGEVEVDYAPPGLRVSIKANL